MGRKERFIGTLDEPLSEDFFDTIALKTAVWQFMVDHFATGVGQFKVHMYCTTEKDFWSRVNARKYRKYTKNDIAIENDKARKREDEYRSLKRLHGRHIEQDRLYGELRKGNLIARLRYMTILTLRRAANKLCPKESP